jgi:hypothetical protein
MVKEFDSNKKYEEYKKKINEYSGGLVTTDKSEFLKLLVFYEVVILPMLNEVVEKLCKAFSGKR